MIPLISFHGLMENSMQPAVSVIVPVYKVEPYLVRCLDSLQNQSLSNIEIILIDDASPDHCGEICERYAAKDRRFKVFCHKENRGLAAARNTGIQLATSNYLMFVDSDDWVHEDFCKTAYDCAIEHNADLVMFGYELQIASKTSKPQIKTETISTGTITKRDAIELTFSVFGMVAWNKLYQKSLFTNIKYPEGSLYEDTGTTYKLIWNAHNIYCMEKVLYYYNCLRSDSIMTQPKSQRTLQHAFTMCLQHCEDLTCWGYSSERLQQQYIDIALNYCMQAIPDSKDICYLRAAKILKNSNTIPAGLTTKRKLLLNLFKLTPHLFHTICKLFNRQI